MNSIISCIVLNYNDAPTTISLVKKIKDYSLIDFVVIVDNCSIDDSWSILQSFKNEKIYLVRASKNGGYGAGNNIGVNFAYETLKSDYVLIANPDVFFEEECVKKLVCTLQENSNAAIVSAKQSNSLDYAWKNCCIMQYILATSLIFEVWFKIRCYSSKYFKGKKQVPVFAVPGSLLMVDASKMIQYGMYDEDFFLYYEEPVLAQKFADAGFETILRLDCSYIHHHHVSISKTYRRWSQQHKLLLKSAELFLKKYKKANAFQMAFAKLWFLYTRFEFWMYDVYKSLGFK